MKHTQTFDYFLTEVINLNKTRVGVAESSIDTMTSFLKNNEVFGENFIIAVPQGSFRQKTIIKPVNPEQDFDVDLLFEMAPVKDWGAADYLQKLAAEFQKTDRYNDKVDTRGKTRCVTIDYESDFHVDIVPCIKKDGGLVIMNKKTDEYETTDGDGYAEWFEGQNKLTGNDYLVKVVRLIKYIRDCNGDLEVKSVLLTTLLGTQIYDSDSNENNHPDLPSSLKTILNRLNSYLQNNLSMPEICNPVLPEESFTRNWTEEHYSKFRDKIQKYNDLINNAYDEPDESESLEIWQQIFGEDFSLPASSDQESAKSDLTFALEKSDHVHPLNEIANSEQLSYKVRIDAYLYTRNGLKRLRGINSDASFAGGLSIKYVAKTNAREPYDVWWQVVNTGRQAAEENGLRGEFFKAKQQNGRPSSNKLVNWEFSKYKGKHWIECFVVQGNICIARSGRFFVNIKGI